MGERVARVAKFSEEGFFVVQIEDDSVSKSKFDLMIHLESNVADCKAMSGLTSSPCMRYCQAVKFGSICSSLPIEDICNHVIRRPTAIVLPSMDLWTKAVDGIRPSLDCLLNNSIVLVEEYVFHVRIKPQFECSKTSGSRCFSFDNIVPSVHTCTKEKESQVQSKPIILLSHISNEEMMLPLWIRHHAAMFDKAVLIDYNSTDSTEALFNENAPTTWTLVKTKQHKFTSRLSDAEILSHESLFPGAWKLVLTVGEFLVASDLRGLVRDAEERGLSFLRFPSFTMVGDDTTGRFDVSAGTSLIAQRSQYAINPSQPREWFGINRFARFLHRLDPDGVNGVRYGSGRHSLEHNGELLTAATMAALGIKGEVVGDGSFIAKYKWTPWPESVPRMLNINAKYSENASAMSVVKGGSVDPHRMVHQFNTSEALSAARDRVLASHFLFDLRTVCINVSDFSSHVEGDGRDDDEGAGAVRRKARKWEGEGLRTDACHLEPLRRRFHRQWLLVTGAVPSFAFYAVTGAGVGQRRECRVPHRRGEGPRGPRDLRISDRFSLETLVIVGHESATKYLNASASAVIGYKLHAGGGEVEIAVEGIASTENMDANLAQDDHDDDDHVDDQRRRLGLEADCRRFCQAELPHYPLPQCVESLVGHLRTYVLDDHHVF